MWEYSLKDSRWRLDMVWKRVVYDDRKVRTVLERILGRKGIEMMVKEKNASLKCKALRWQGRGT
jgi:hypothetical protein